MKKILLTIFLILSLITITNVHADTGFVSSGGTTGLGNCFTNVSASWFVNSSFPSTIYNVNVTMSGGGGGVPYTMNSWIDGQYIGSMYFWGVGQKDNSTFNSSTYNIINGNISFTGGGSHQFSYNHNGMDSAFQPNASACAGRGYWTLKSFTFDYTATTTTTTTTTTVLTTSQESYLKDAGEGVGGFLSAITLPLAIFLFVLIIIIMFFMAIFGSVIGKVSGSIRGR